MKVVDIADDVYRELGSPTSLSIPAIAFYIRSAVGALNSYINEEYFIYTGNLEIVKDVDGSNIEIGEEESSILKKMYLVHYYDSKIRTNLTALDADTIIEVTDQGSSVRKINKNEQGKIYAGVRNILSVELKEMIASYKLNDVQPLQVAGDDDQSAYILPNREYIRITKY